MKFDPTQILFFALMIGILYFMIFLPKKKEQQAFTKMIQSLKKGDRVLTQSGMYGEVASLQGDIVTLKFHDGVRIDFNKTAISKALEDKAEAKA